MRHLSVNNPATMIITMAGLGSRFRDAGYTIPKFMIEARGASLFDWSMTGLRSFIGAGASFVFVVRAEDNATDFIRVRAAANGIHRFEIIELVAPTDGQATTARIAVSNIAAESPIAIFNIDTGVRANLLHPPDRADDGWIPCFRAPGDSWSFVLTDRNGLAIEVREKQRISEFATIGFYWFATAELYASAYDNYYSVAGREERGERYVAPLYNQLIADGKRITVTEIPYEAITALGTPADLDRFVKKGKVRC